MIELVGDSLYLGDYDAMRTWADRAVDAAELLGDHALLAAALAGRALASAGGGRATEGLRYSADAAALIDGLADEQIGGRLDALAHLATAEFYLENFARAGSHAERVEDRPYRRKGRSLPAHRPNAGRQPLGSRPHGGGRGGPRWRDCGRTACR
jgi:hypothetical protein